MNRLPVSSRYKKDKMLLALKKLEPTFMEEVGLQSRQKQLISRYSGQPQIQQPRNSTIEDNFEKAEKILNIKKLQDDLYGADHELRRMVKERADREEGADIELSVIKSLFDSESSDEPAFRKDSEIDLSVLEDFL